MERQTNLTLVKVADCRMSMSGTVRVLTDEMVDTLADRIRAEGLCRPIDVEERATYFNILDGHIRVQALKKLGWQWIIANVVPKVQPEEKFSDFLKRDAEKYPDGIERPDNCDVIG